MGDFDAADMIARGVQALRKLHRPDGSWTMEVRSLEALVALGCALKVVDRFPPSLGRELERADMESTGTTEQTYGARLLRGGDDRRGASERPAPTPLVLFYQWLLAPGEREAALGFRPRPRFLHRRFARWAGWPDLDALDALLERPDWLPSAAALLALMLHARSRPLGRDLERTRARVLPLLEAEARAGMSLAVAAPALVCFRALGREDDAKRVERTIADVAHREGGWVRGGRPGSDKVATAQAVLAVLDVGVADDDADLASACGYLAKPSGDDSDVEAFASAVVARHQAGETPEVSLDTIAAREAALGSKSVAGGAAWLMALLAAGAPMTDPRIARASERLVAQQRPDGSWFDPRTTATTHAMMHALEAITLVGPKAVGDPEIERSIHYLTRSQNIDGGWGFDEGGARSKRSTVEATAAAVICLSRHTRPRARPMYAIDSGVRFLMRAQDAGGGWPSERSTLMPLVLSLRALVAQGEIREQHLASAAKLVRNRRIAKKKSAAAGPSS